MTTPAFKSLRPTTYKRLGPAPAKKVLSVLSNPCHDEQGRFCSTGGGIWGKGEEFSIQSERMEHRIQNASDQKLFIDSFLKDSEKNWLDAGREVKVVETIVDIHRASNGAYLNYIHSLRQGKGYASEVMKTIIGLLDKSGINTIRGYTESHNLAPQTMFKKFGFSEESRTSQGITWVRTISRPATHALSTHSLSTHSKPKPTARPRLVRINGLLAHQANNRTDPTKTTALRNRWAAEMSRRFTALRQLIYRTIVDDDCFGLGPAYKLYRPTVHSNPCHDEQGRFCSTGGGGSVSGESNISMFHGTSSDYIDSIMKHGLIAAASPGGDAWAEKEGDYAISRCKIGDREASVYMTSELRVASSYAGLAAQVSGGTPVILKVEIPAAYTGRMTKDEKDSEAIRFTGRIKPEWITEQIHERGASSSISIRKKGRMISLSQDQTKIFYLVVIVDNHSAPATHSLSAHASFNFPTSQQKVEAFMTWLRKQQDEGILEIIELPRLGQSLGDPWTNMFVKDSYERGVIRAREQLMSAGYGAPGLGAVEALPLLGTPALSGILANPFHVDRLASMYMRSYEGLKGITSAMDMQISHVLAQGMADGDNPITLAKKMNYVISGMGENLGVTDSLGRFIPAERRAKMLARTEVIRAHAQATLQEAKNWGVAGVDVEAEFTTKGFNVCPLCQELAAKGPYTIEEAMNLIPAHPHCFCAWIIKPKDQPRRIMYGTLAAHSNPCHNPAGPGGGQFCGTGAGGGSPWSSVTSKQEAVERFKQDFGINLSVDRDFQLQLVNEVGKEFQRMKETFPDVPVNEVAKEVILTTGPLGRSGKANGEYDTNGPTISLRPAAIGKEEITLGEFSSTSDRLSALMRHEYGHGVHEYLWRSEQNRRSWMDVWEGIGSGSHYQRAKAISHYGAQIPQETFAESFRAWTSHSYKFGMLPRGVEAYFSNVLTRKD